MSYNRARLSAVRSLGSPVGLPGAPGDLRQQVPMENLLAQLVARLARAQHRAGGFWQLEQPSESLLLQVQPVLDVIHDAEATLAVRSACVDGAPLATRPHIGGEPAPRWPRPRPSREPCRAWPPVAADDLRVLAVVCIQGLRRVAVGEADAGRARYGAPGGHRCVARGRPPLRVGAAVAAWREEWGERGGTAVAAR